MAGNTDIGVFLLGLAFVGTGVLFWWFNKRKRDACTGKVDGVVKNVDHSVTYSNGRRGSSKYRTAYAYSVNGVDYFKQSNVSSTKTSRFSEGQTVTVFYDPSKPQRFYVLEAGSNIVVTLFFVCFGVVFMIISGFFDVIFLMLDR